MKARERHRLKTNEFAIRVAQVTEFIATHRDRVIVGGLIVVGLVLTGVSYSWYRNKKANEAGALLGAAMTIPDAPIVPAPTVPGATQQAGTYPTPVARAEAGVEAFQKVIEAYPSTVAAVAARYHRAAALMALGRVGEAEQGYQATIDAAGDSVYGPMAKMGQAEALVALGQFDRGLQMFETLAADRDGMLPVDGVLMQLAHAYEKAQRAADARTAFKRVVDEFPESVYVTQAREELARLG